MTLITGTSGNFDRRLYINATAIVNGSTAMKSHCGGFPSVAHTPEVSANIAAGNLVENVTTAPNPMLDVSIQNIGNIGDAYTTPFKQQSEPTSTSITILEDYGQTAFNNLMQDVDTFSTSGDKNYRLFSLVYTSGSDQNSLNFYAFCNSWSGNTDAGAIREITFNLIILQNFIGLTHTS